ncbi:cell cycle regulatory protein [Gonapodya prolifera JEL478]|uniref:Cell cycle regulatory protein n=1 Tax=Gonapodya prolifera (strain JEL478) TaxID=1344416 RepID=A0A139AU06_GONPJ|nr:cell cycle regulatory protein [Gonapodya prolifera JEL478]|eukprot:KXS20184.1 cell cycle regulatory protein [Gonapodya prolifera JEL478]
MPHNAPPSTPVRSRISHSPSLLTSRSQAILAAPRKQGRHIVRVPYKVLDAPELKDDFYLNLVDWSSGNTMVVGLGSAVYLWSAITTKVTKLCDLADLGSDTVTGVSWSGKGNVLAVGTNKGYVQLWDVAKGKMFRSMRGHGARVGSIAWNGDVVSSGGRDRTIFHRDTRDKSDYFRTLYGHKQEICGLKWNVDDQMMASGGNDNQLLIWDKFEATPRHILAAHSAAVKAIAWSPHQRGLLASGGGTADRRIRFWNASSGQCLQEVDTTQQVCNLAWSQTSVELVSTHGYSNNQVLIWDYPSMKPTATLTGHTMRVLFLAMSPDGQNIVTGAGDETLRFWVSIMNGTELIGSITDQSFISKQHVFDGRKQKEARGMSIADMPSLR